MSSTLSKGNYTKFIQKRFVLTTICISLLYIILSVYLINYRLVGETLFGNYTLLYKTRLLFYLLEGLFTSFTLLDIVLLIITAVLVGTNMSIMFNTLKNLQKQGHIRLTVGGATLLGIAVGGCGTCGISILAILGLSAALSSLPFHGLEIHITAIVLLLGSLYYLIRKSNEEIACKISPTNKK